MNHYFFLFGTGHEFFSGDIKNAMIILEIISDTVYICLKVLNLIRCLFKHVTISYDIVLEKVLIS